MIDLSGTWAFSLDPDDRGIDEEWQKRVLADVVNLPGSLQEQGFGDEVSADTKWVGSIFDDSWYVQKRYAKYRISGNVKVPFWLQPKKHYQGVAWYQRTVQIPEQWANRRVTLTLERTHWSTQVWLDDRAVGKCDSLSTPHVYDLGVVAAGTQQLTIRVDNRIFVDVGPNAHSVSDHTQTNWNGVIGRLELAALDPVQIADLRITPNITRRSFLLEVVLRNTLPAACKGQLTVRASLCNVEQKHEPPPVILDVALNGDLTTIAAEYSLGEDAQLWDEFHPALYSVIATLDVEADGAFFTDSAESVTGLREVGTNGTHIVINGRRVFLRGTLECCIFPHTGYPPTDVEAWRRIVRICKEHGLNHLRFHSWCPPRAAFQAADELGLYYQIECAAWVNQGPGIGLGLSVDQWLYAEGERITSTYGNHPSFIMMAHGNEPGGNDAVWLAEWVTYWKKRDPRRIHTGGAGWPEIQENQYHNLVGPRIQMWGAELNSRINALPPETCTDYREQVTASPIPIVSHEVGQWCVYPNFQELAKYDGFLKARNFEIFLESLEENHMADQAHDFLMASGKLQVLCYKEEIESLLRTPGLGGFQLLDLHDFPGQGTALVGVLDPFWDAKPYVDAQEFRRFCNSTVLLARMEKRYWLSSERFVAEVEIAHHGAEALSDVNLEWRVIDRDGKQVAQGAFQVGRVPEGGNHPIGRIEVDMQQMAPSHRYRLIVGIRGTEFENDWDFWLFADELDTSAPASVHITDSLTEEALAILRAGGKVLLALRAEDVRTSSKIGFSSVFWNTSWTKSQGHTPNWPDGQAPHTLGILCAPEHPVFANFPTEYYSNWQWWELIHGSAAMVLDSLPAQLRPLIQPIDTWFENRRLGLLFEAQVEGGSLLVCSMDISGHLEERPVARQMRHSILHYMDSTAFVPTHEIDLENLRSLFLS